MTRLTYLSYTIQRWAWVHEGNSEEVEETEATVGISGLKSCCPHCDPAQITVLAFL